MTWRFLSRDYASRAADNEISEIQVNDVNAKVIREFRENAGKVNGSFEGTSLLLLHTIGAKTTLFGLLNTGAGVSATAVTE